MGYPTHRQYLRHPAPYFRQDRCCNVPHEVGRLPRTTRAILPIPTLLPTLAAACSRELDRKDAAENLHGELPRGGWTGSGTRRSRERGSSHSTWSVSCRRGDSNFSFSSWPWSPNSSKAVWVLPMEDVTPGPMQTGSSFAAGQIVGY